ncbi:MAG: hypothetical protein IPP97_16965 [Candidatus Obscuribacter sp.]|nr:hypothetical protein [Candidatus Obscuribacter sp.]MBP6348935.1 hypothetical protein [Candidatus Obscuribacter sp.]MBP6593160.1 hypothetical protein [Candidatus Obscuribacter sp.]MBP7576175.1 hypothetical protein [Candidatus Obscuribacter sp.]
MKVVRFSSIVLGLMGIFLIAISLNPSYNQSESQKAELRARGEEARRITEAFKAIEDAQKKEDQERKNGSETAPVLEYLIAQPHK